LKRKLHRPLQLCRPLLVACAKFSCTTTAVANPLPNQFVDELKEFECKVYSLSTYSDPSHLPSLSLLLLLLLLHSEHGLHHSTSTRSAAAETLSTLCP